MTAGAPANRRRNAAHTRQLLLEVASSRFARDGYATTTVRDIADDANVNVALISRYFTSKEGLFEACLAAAVTELRQEPEDTPVERIGAAMAHRIAASTPDGRLPETLLLLLRSSGDEHLDEIRRGVLRSMSERMATVAAGPASPDGQQLVLRAQIVLAAALGVTLLRSSLSIEPLASADEETLAAPLSDLVTALLTKKDA
ncbi:MAG: TetR family transcriptional regulator [Actinoplanes sp.]